MQGRADESVTYRIALRYPHRQHLVPIVAEVTDAPPVFIAVRGFAATQLNWVGLATVPIRVENRRELRHYGSDNQHVHAHEMAGRAARKVFIGDISAALDRDRTIC